MGLYKILLVDDEEEVRHAIARKIDWNFLGFELAEEASNGIEALEMLPQIMPDVIVADIQMPFMDGLTLCRRAKEMMPDIKIVIFSGFDEFDYAREAIKLDVIEYIMKPINAAELSGVLRRIADALDEEVSERLNFERIRSLYDESIPLLRQQMLSMLISGRTVSEQIRTEQEMNLSAEKYAVAVIKYSADVSAKEFSDEEIRLLPYSLQQIINENLGNEPAFYSIIYPDHIVLVFLLPEAVGMYDIMARLSMLILPVKKLLGMNLYIGLGNSSRKLDDISFAYDEALDALEYNKILDDEHVVYIGDIVPGSKERKLRSSEFVGEILRSVKIGDKDGMEAAICALTENFESNPPGLIRYRYFLFAFSAGLNKLTQIYDLDYTEHTEAMERLLFEKNLKPQPDFQDMKRWLLDWSETVRLQIKSKRKNSTSELVENAKIYIGEHYGDSDLSLEQLCNVLNVSQPYFSTIFKKATGNSFISWLTEVRMNAAVDLLGSTDEKTYIIAEKIGYADPNYFSYVFKKHFGSAPTKYRSEHFSEPG